MKNMKSALHGVSALKFISVLALFLSLAVNGLAQNALAGISADEVVKQIEAGQPIKYENVAITGDFDLSHLSRRTNDAIYPEKNKTARVSRRT